LAQRFDAHRAQLRAVAYRMLGSFAEADDAVQEAWLRLARTDAAAVQNLQAWSMTVVSRICLDVLRTRVARREVPLEVHVPDPVVSLDPERAAEQADEVGLALLVVLDTLAPAERVAFVLHDVFAVPFEEIAAIVERSPAAARQLASRARRRARAAPVPDSDVVRQREVVEAFLAAARDGDFDALLTLLDPDVLLRADAGQGPLGPSRLLRGAREVATQATQYARLAQYARPALVNGRPGVVAMPGDQLLAVLVPTIAGGRIVEITILADPARLARIPH
jgi:RNA polymerase sigma-70 factor (ECF subfamily)